MLSVTLPISKKLQQANIEFTDAATTVRDALAVIKKRRSHCNYFDEVFQSASEAMQDLNVPVAVPRTTGRQKNRANVPAASPIEYYRRAVFFPLLDCVISDLSNRFTEDTFNTLSDLACFIPSHIVANDSQADTNINSDNIMKTYGACLTAESVPVDKFMLRAEVDLWQQKWRRTQAANEAIPNTAIEGLLACDEQTFPIIRSLLTILLSLPVSTAGVERSFSTLRRL